ncbi:unnamed protein product, partial [Mesorhabditis spiculigera]
MAGFYVALLATVAFGPATGFIFGVKETTTQGSLRTHCVILYNVPEDVTGAGLPALIGSMLHQFGSNVSQRSVAYRNVPYPEQERANIQILNATWLDNGPRRDAKIVLNSGNDVRTFMDTVEKARGAENLYARAMIC